MKIRRNTVAKTEIQNLLSNSENALSHLEIQKMLNGLCDRVTIYRVLDRLVVDGVAHKIVDFDGVVKYAYCHTCSSEKHYHQHNHIHFSCEKCKSVTCLEHIEPAFNLPENYIVKETNFTVSGVCPDCSEKKIKRNIA